MQQKTGFIPLPAPPYSDVPPNHWASGYITLATWLFLMGGYPDGTFKPDRQVTRAELAKVAVRQVEITLAFAGGFAVLAWLLARRKKEE